MFGSPLLSKLVGLLRRRSHSPLVLRILYNLSVEERGRASMAKTDVPAYLRKQVMGWGVGAGKRRSMGRVRWGLQAKER
jgi:hypothetical protein